MSSRDYIPASRSALLPDRCIRWSVAFDVWDTVRDLRCQVWFRCEHSQWQYISSKLSQVSRAGFAKRRSTRLCRGAGQICQWRRTVGADPRLGVMERLFRRSKM